MDVVKRRKRTMSKCNKAAIIKLCQEIEKKEGEGIVYSLGSSKANLKIPRWSTGIADLDAIIGGGMPEGRFVEIFGGESAGKTSLGYQLSGLHDIALNIPIEGTFDAARAKVFGNRPKQLLIYRATYGEQAFNKAIKFAQAGIPLIIIDSIPSCQPKADIEKIKKAVNKDEEVETTIGGIPRLLGKYLPVLNDIIEVTGTTVILINQVRDKMNALMFGEKTDTPGGHSLRHHCSLRLQVARKGWITIPNKNPSIVDADEKVGLIMKVKVVKSKVSNPQGTCEIPMFFDRGFVSWEDVDKVRKEILRSRCEQFGKRMPKEDVE